MLLALGTACRRDPVERPDTPALPQVAVAACPTPEAEIETDSEPATGSNSPMLLSEKNPLAGCRLCHVDIEDEFMPSTHFAEGVGCVDCHGLSKEHLADENNEVKPEVLFTRENTDSLCSECHGCSRPESQKPATPHKICTDCHGPHNLAMAE